MQIVFLKQMKFLMSELPFCCYFLNTLCGSVIYWAAGLWGEQDTAPALRVLSVGNTVSQSTAGDVESVPNC